MCMKSGESQQDSKREVLVKCSSCYQTVWCMLLRSQRQWCLGPFCDLEDSLNKLRAAYRAKEEADVKDREKGLERFKRLSRIDEYRERRLVLEMELAKGQNDDNVG